MHSRQLIIYDLTKPCVGSCNNRIGIPNAGSTAVERCRLGHCQIEGKAVPKRGSGCALWEALIRAYVTCQPHQPRNQAVISKGEDMGHTGYTKSRVRLWFLIDKNVFPEIVPPTPAAWIMAFPKAELSLAYQITILPQRPGYDLRWGWDEPFRRDRLGAVYDYSGSYGGAVSIKTGRRSLNLRGRRRGTGNHLFLCSLEAPCSFIFQELH